MTTKNKNQYIINQVGSLVDKKYFIFENPCFVVHFTPSQTGVLFWVIQ